MENFYLIKVDETTLKRILNIDATMDVIEIESAADMARVNTLIKGMKLDVSAYTFYTKMGKSIRSSKEGFKLSDVFTYKGERYYTSMEVLDMLSEITIKKTSKPLQVDNLLVRVESLRDRVIWERKHTKNK